MKIIFHEILTCKLAPFLNVLNEGTIKNKSQRIMRHDSFSISGKDQKAADSGTLPTGAAAERLESDFLYPPTSIIPAVSYIPSVSHRVDRKIPTSFPLRQGSGRRGNETLARDNEIIRFFLLRALHGSRILRDHGPEQASSYQRRTLKRAISIYTQNTAQYLVGSRTFRHGLSTGSIPTGGVLAWLKIDDSH